MRLGTLGHWVFGGLAVTGLAWADLPTEIDPNAPGVTFFVRNGLIDPSSATPPLTVEATDPANLRELRSFYRHNFWKRESCDVVFSTTPPAIVQRMFGPQIDALAPWQPVCGHMSILEGLRDAYSTGDEILAAYLEQTVGDDVCGDSRRDRFSPAAQARLQQAQPEPTPTPQAPSPEQEDRAKRKRLQFLSSVARIRSDVVNICCADSTSCQNYIERAEIEFCEQTAEPETCRHYTASVKTIFDRAFWKNYFQNVIQYPVRPGEDHDLRQLPRRLRQNPLPIPVVKVWLDPDGDIAERDWPIVLRHEFAHLCSAARQHAEAASGNRTQLHRFYRRAMFNERSSRLDRGMREFYSRLYKRIGLSKQSIECLFGVAAGSRLSRFAPTHECTTVRPSMYLEEGFAALVPFILAPPAMHFDMIWRACVTQRDGTHPLSADVLACAIQTPAIRERLSRGLDCR